MSMSITPMADYSDYESRFPFKCKDCSKRISLKMFAYGNCRCLDCQKKYNIKTYSPGMAKIINSSLKMYESKRIHYKGAHVYHEGIQGSFL